MKHIRKFNSGFISSANFSEIEGADEHLLKTALVACEGEFPDSKGNPYKFDADRLNTIADHTNKAIDTGTIIPVCTDHKKEVLSTVGSVDGHAYTKVIESQDLPNSKATHLIGKVGLFLDKVVLKSKEVADKVAKNIVTSVSMGLNLDPNDHRIIELSLVPIPAIPNMGLFKMGLEENTTSVTWEDLETEQQSLDSIKESFDDLTEKLWIILNNIYSSDSVDISDVETLKQYVYTALNGFSIRVVDTLGLTDVSSSSVDPSTGTLTAEDQSAMAQTQYQDLTSPGTTQYKYRRSNVSNFGNSRKYYLANKYNVTFNR